MDADLFIYLVLWNATGNRFLTSSKTHPINVLAVSSSVPWKILLVVWTATFLGFPVDDVAASVLSDNKELVGA